MAQVTVVDHPLVAHRLGQMRRKETSTADFRRLMRETGALLCYEACRDIPTERVEVETPIAKTTVVEAPAGSVVLAPVLRAGLGMLDGALELIPSARVAHIGFYRDPATLEAVEYYFKAPEGVADRLVILVDPMLATGHTAVAAVGKLRERGVRSIRFVCLLAAPEGVATFTAACPDVPVFTASIDERLNDHGYIVPGLGDAGDRLYGTK